MRGLGVDEASTEGKNSDDVVAYGRGLDCPERGGVSNGRSGVGSGLDTGSVSDRW